MDAGLWCVNIGYGRQGMAMVAARPDARAKLYNTFFMTSHVPAIALAKISRPLAPGDLNHVFFARIKGPKRTIQTFAMVPHLLGS